MLERQCVGLSSENLACGHRPAVEQLVAGCENYRGVLRAMRLNPPSILIFVISFVLALLAVSTKLTFLSVPHYLPHQEYWLAITAYVTLMIGNLVKGL